MLAAYHAGLGLEIDFGSCVIHTLLVLFDISATLSAVRDVLVGHYWCPMHERRSGGRHSVASELVLAQMNGSIEWSTLWSRRGSLPKLG